MTAGTPILGLASRHGTTGRAVEKASATSSQVASVMGGVWIIEATTATSHETCKRPMGVKHTEPAQAQSVQNFLSGGGQIFEVTISEKVCG